MTASQPYAAEGAPVVDISAKWIFQLRLGRMDEGPGADFGIAGHFDIDQIGTAVLQRLFQRRLEMIRRGNASRADAKRVRELDEIRIDQVGGDETSVKALALVAPHIAVRIVVEHEHDDADLELHGGRQFLHAEHEAAVAGDRDHGRSGWATLAPSAVG